MLEDEFLSTLIAQNNVWLKTQSSGNGFHDFNSHTRSSIKFKETILMVELLNSTVKDSNAYCLSVMFIPQYTNETTCFHEENGKQALIGLKN